MGRTGGSGGRAVDTFCSGNNGATSLFAGLNDLSFQAESNDTHHDCCFKKIGSGLGHFSMCVKIAINLEFCGIANFEELR